MMKSACLSACASILLAALPATAKTPAEVFAARCRQLADQAARDNATVIRGSNGWLFLPAEIRHLGADGTNLADALPAIVDTARQLREKDIRLLLVPVPPKAVIYPDALGVTGPVVRIDESLAAFHTRLRAEGLDVLDLTPAFLRAREQDATEGPVYCRQDSHWSPRGAALAARDIAAWIRETCKDLPAGQAAAATGGRSPALSGDLWRMLGDESIPKETLPLPRPGKAYPNDPRSPVLLLADSHGLVFHAGGDMHAEGAGVGDHLAAELGMPVDLLARRGSAATAVRIDLARRNRAEPGSMAGRKVVVWCFAAREYTESAGWRMVPLFPKSVLPGTASP